MTSYNTIINIVDGSTSFSGPYGGSCSDSSSVFNYTPEIPTVSFDTIPDFHTVNSWKDPSDSESFSAIRKSGGIKMTKYSVGKVTTDKFIIQLKRASAKLGWPHCIDQSWYGEQIKAVSTWTEQTHFDVFSHPTFGSASDSPADHDRARNEAMSKCVSESAQTLDALTTLAEGPKTITTMVNALKAVANPLRAISSLRSKGSVSAVADAWLTYRYAIMPNVYTVRDSMDLLDQAGAIFKTSRSKEVVNAKSDYTDPGLSGPYGYWLEYNRSGQTEYRATGKAKYDNATLRTWDQTSINPFLTGWELVPYSFVVDWFINVGDWILSRSILLNDAATSRLFCLATKTSVTETWYYHQRDSLESLREYPAGNVEVSIPLNSKGKALQVVTDKYDRVIFEPRDVGLSWNPSLTGLRSLDAAALSVKPILSSLRKLK